MSRRALVLVASLTACGPAIDSSASEAWRLCVTSATVDPRVEMPRVSVSLTGPGAADPLMTWPVSGLTPVWVDACAVRASAELAEGVRLSFWQHPEVGDPFVLWSTLLKMPEPHRLFRQEIIDDRVDDYHLSFDRAP